MIDSIYTLKRFVNNYYDTICLFKERVLKLYHG